MVVRSPFVKAQQLILLVGVDEKIPSTLREFLTLPRDPYKPSFHSGLQNSLDERNWKTPFELKISILFFSKIYFFILQKFLMDYINVFFTQPHPASIAYNSCFSFTSFVITSFSLRWF